MNKLLLTLVALLIMSESSFAITTEWPQLCRLKMIALVRSKEKTKQLMTKRLPELLSSKRAFQYALSLGADIGDTFWNSSLFNAVVRGKMDEVRMVLDAGADVNMTSGRSVETALHKAVSMDRPEIVKLLLSRGADIHASGEGWGDTPLYFANVRTAQILLDAGADPNLLGRSGHTPFQNAIANNNVELVHLYLQHSKSWEPKKKSEVFRRGLILAVAHFGMHAPVENGRAIVKDFIRHGANPNYRSGENGSALDFLENKILEERSRSGLLFNGRYIQELFDLKELMLAD